ncbi:MAG: nucleotidyltransferase domain-containing protein [Nitrospirae bacterium]|nr:nucleotidyltransferase domain-containing protein [Nitrospirota bacterium]
MGLRQKAKIRREWTIETLRGSLAPLANDPMIRLVVLFGSVAGGAPELAHDIDLAFLMDGRIDIVGLTNKISPLLREDAVDIVDLRRASPLLAARVALQGVPLFERTQGEFACFRSLAWRRYVDTAKLRRLQHESLHRSLAAWTST